MPRAWPSHSRWPAAIRLWQVRVRFDGEDLPTLNAAADLGAIGAFDGSGKAWIGFTASTGITSIDTDILSFAYCSKPGCDAA